MEIVRNRVFSVSLDITMTRLGMYGVHVYSEKRQEINKNSLKCEIEICICRCSFLFIKLCYATDSIRHRIQSLAIENALFMPNRSSTRLVTFFTLARTYTFE